MLINIVFEKHLFAFFVETVFLLVSFNLFGNIQNIAQISAIAQISSKFKILKAKDAKLCLPMSILLSLQIK
jgi:hypothetical protein